MSLEGVFSFVVLLHLFFPFRLSLLRMGFLFLSFEPLGHSMLPSYSSRLKEVHSLEHYGKPERGCGGFTKEGGSGGEGGILV